MGYLIQRINFSVLDLLDTKVNIILIRISLESVVVYGDDHAAGR